MFRGLFSAPEPAGEGFARSGTLSVALHALLIAAAAMAGRRDTTPPPDRPRVDTTTFILRGDEPRDPDVRLPRGWGVRSLLLDLPGLIAPIALSAIPLLPVNPHVEWTGDVPVTLVALGHPGDVFIEAAVDERPERLSSPPLE